MTGAGRAAEREVVLLTGAAGGFGGAIARAFAAKGAALVLGDIDAAPLAVLVADLRSAGAEVDMAVGDVALRETHQALVDLAMARFGRLDIAINNAGIAHRPARLHEIDPGEAARVIEVNLLGCFHALAVQAPCMARSQAGTGRRGRIVNIASAAGLVGAPRASVYAAAKHGVVGLTRSAAAEYAMAGLRVNALCPSFARTAMVEEGLLGGRDDRDDRAAAAARLVSAIPLGRMAEPEEIVSAVLWLADPANSFATGLALALDGGLTAL